MRRTLQSVGLVLLLLLAQQAGVVHEVGHLLDRQGSASEQRAGEIETSCASCPTFAQVATPAFSHSFTLPTRTAGAYTVSREQRHHLFDSAVPTPRSRGPPSPT